MSGQINCSKAWRIACVQEHMTPPESRVNSVKVRQQTEQQSVIIDAVDLWRPTSSYASHDGS